MGLKAMGMAMAKLDEQRRANRVSVRLVTHDAVGDYPLTLINLSTSGMMLSSPRALRVGDTVQVDLPQIGNTAAEVMWHDADEYGCRFFAPIPASVVDDAARRTRSNMPHPVEAPRRRVREVRTERDDTRSLVVLCLFLAFVVVLFYSVQAILGN